MKRWRIILFIGLVILISSPKWVYSENRKLAQTGLKFLYVSLDARGSSLGSALTAVEGFSTALLYNPAGMSRMNEFFQFSMGRVNWIADIQYLFGTAAINLAQGRYGVLGFSFLSADYGTFKGTIRANNEQGFMDTGNYNPTSFAFGVGYARALSDKFSVGGHVRYIYQNLTGGVIDFTANEGIISKNFDLDVISFDFGILYKTGFKSLNFGMCIRNFSRELKYINESFQLPLIFEMGLSFDMFDIIPSINSESHSLLLSVDAVHPRDNYEQVDLGMEYLFMNSFALRLGYTFPADEQGMTFGAGFYQNISRIGLGIDYAYTPFGIFEDVHRLTIRFSL